MRVGEGVREWCILRAGSGAREKVVAEFLDDLGFETWYPTTRVPVGRARRPHSTKHMVRMPMIPPYLFVGFRIGGRGWETIIEHREHFGAVVYRGERPLTFDPCGFAAMRERFLKARRVAMREARESSRRKLLKVGDRVVFKVGPLANEPVNGRLTEIDGVVARGLMTILGTDRLFEAPLDALARAA